MFEKVTIGNATLYHGDCMEILPTLGMVDAVITDPPYGIEKSVSNLRKSKGIGSKGDYRTDTFDDNRDYIKNKVVPAIKICLQIAKRAALTTGVKCMYEYPEPSHIGTYQYPASTTVCSWGMKLWQPILYYGKDPYPGRLKADSKRNCTDSERSVDHPCPKPYKQTEWLVSRASLPDETVLDPFMGSGTTGVACMNLGRKFIGIEIERKYFDIACNRIEQAQKQVRMFE